MKKATKLKTLEDVKAQNRVPYLRQKFRTTQETIPVDTVFPDGIFHLPNGLPDGGYSATWRFTDVNYGVAEKAERDNIFIGWGDLLSGLPEGVSSKVTIFNRRRDRNLSEALLLPGNGRLEAEYNRYVTDLLDSGNGIIQDKYITINAAGKKDVREARSYFSKTEASLRSAFQHIGSTISRMQLPERLRVFHDFYRFGTEDRFQMALDKNGGFKDLIAPMSMWFDPQRIRDHMEMGNLFVRSLSLTGFGGFISDDLISELCRLERPMMLSIDVIPIPLQESVAETQRRYDSTEAAVATFREKKSSQAVPYALESERLKAKEVLDELLGNNQEMLGITVTLAHIAGSKEELDNDTETLKNICAQRHCRLDTLTHQQIDGLNTVLPYGQIFVPYDYLMTTNPAAALMPFSSQEVCDRTGIPYGRQAVSGNILVVDKRGLVNGNSVITGTSGSGKSMVAKKEIISLRLRYGDSVDIIVMDPDGEYGKIIKPLGGAVFDIETGGNMHLNALDMDEAYDDKNPLALKSEFLITLIEEMMEKEQLSTKERSIIDRAVSNVYRDFRKGKFSDPPTLIELSNELENQGKEGAALAQSIALYTTGTLNIFAQQTNVDSKNALTCYCIRDLGAKLKTTAMFVVLDQIWNRVVRNYLSGRTTYIYVDEIYLMFMQENTAEFFYKLWKRIRKYNGLLTGITQNVEDCLRTHAGKDILANSEFLLMMRQNPSDAAALADLLHISENQISHLLNANPGDGLMKVGSAIVPFVDKFPADTELYRIMSTNPREAKKS